MFTPISVQATIENPNGSPANGYIDFRLAAQMLNDGELALPAPISAQVVNGRILDSTFAPLILLANDDVDTTPVDPLSGYQVLPKLVGAIMAGFFFVLPTASSVMDPECVTVEGTPIVTLGKYLAASSMIGKVVSGSTIPGGATVLDVDTKANQVTLSENASGSSAPFVELVFPGAVDLLTLIPLS